ncbi:MAG: rhomboid family intramembrane serine protease [Prevotellaceae bacterium]|jgi:membrane associated rhomboid family serine protease|nr:rhomboid family intramembrane serine protease [Prevotellaceae bacterium]
MTNPHTLLAAVTVGASIIAFQNRKFMSEAVLYPYIMLRNNQWYRLVTHAFIHADWVHLLFNMIALWSFGSFAYSSMELLTPFPVLHFFTLYFGAVLFSSIHNTVKHRNNTQYASLGASGAVSAIIFFSILLNPWSLIMIFIIPCPGIIFGVLFLVYSSYMSKRNGDRIDHGAHFYGSLFGLFYPLIINKDIYVIFIKQLLNPHFH